ncbi:MAG TPA: peptidase M17, partial [Pseudonocardiaceae bacterium]|nr:peptidase M17 [Pseudonocardiaceae bacterium]
MTPPTPLADVAVAAELKRGVPLAVTVADQLELGPHFERLGIDPSWLEAAGVTGRAGTVHAVPRPGSRPGTAWLVGVGTGSVRDYRAAGAALTRAVGARAETDRDAGRPATRAVQLALPAPAGTDHAVAFALGAALGSYRFRITGNDRSQAARSVTLIGPGELTPAVARAMVLARATGLTRDLANTPSDVKDPAWLATTAARLAERVPGVVA